MGTLTRQTQKVFAGNANAGQIAIMGTMKTGIPQYDTSLANLQSAEYQLGWADAILNDKAPYLEEMNGVQYGFSYQIAYLLQEGIPEYDANTAYSLNSIVKVINGNELMFYHPIQLDANNECKGHALSDTNWWVRLNISDFGRIGDPISRLTNTLPDGLAPQYSSYIWLDGSARSRLTYSALFAIYGTTYGAGDGSTTFNLPNFTDKAIWGYNGSFGNINAGLPNITAIAEQNGDHAHNGGSLHNNNGYVNCVADGTDGTIFKQSSADTDYFDRSASGGWGKARKVTLNIKNLEGSTSTTGKHGHNITVSASTSGILGNSTTVQPPAIKVRVCTRWR